ncbi:g10329 [Coccomyxa elongata]
MARLGVWQLRKLTLNYCSFSGSSKGARAFVEDFLPTFKQENPHLQIIEELQPGQHPYLKAEYRNGRVRTVGVKNELPNEVLRHAVMLRSAAGRSTHVKVKSRQTQPAIKTEDGQHRRASPSVQGMWQPGIVL